LKDTGRWKAPLTKDNAGFLWHDVVTPKDEMGDTGFEITPEFESLMGKVGAEVGWDIKGAKMEDGMYSADLFVRPDYFDYGKLERYLTKKRGDKKSMALAKKIKKLRKEIIDRGYEELAKEILEDVVFKRLTNGSARKSVPFVMGIIVSIFVYL
jgi:hypothetical protein